MQFRFRCYRNPDHGAEHGRKAQPACVVVPLTGRAGDVVLFPLTTQEPAAGRLAVRVPETERRRLRLRGAAANWVLLDEGNRDVLPGSFHVEPIRHDPPSYAYGAFSAAFMRVVLRTLAAALRSGQTRVVTRER